MIGFGFAKLIKKGISKLLNKIKLNEHLTTKVGESLEAEQFIGNLIYYIILLWVLLLTLDVLGVRGVLDPVMNLFNNFVAILPNIIAAILIGLSGYVIAKILSSSIEVVAKGLDGVSEKLGISEQFSLSKLSGQLIFIIIFIPVLISALDALKIDAISVPATEMLASLLSAVPRILASALIVGIAFIVGGFVTKILAELLQNLGADQIPEKIGIHEMLADDSSFSKICGRVVFFFIMLAASVSAVEQLAMPQLSNVLSDFLVFSGQILLGLVVLAIGNFIANLAYKALSKTVENSGLASIARIAIIGLVLAMGLRAM
ncbi:mechanosensitive ion channel, partial [Patescibacteria group bacterium]|nr:mechanosensitive ion channel [Patescibacteria group bacterium]